MSAPCHCSIYMFHIFPQGHYGGWGVGKRLRAAVDHRPTAEDIDPANKHFRPCWPHAATMSMIHERAMDHGDTHVGLVRCEDSGGDPELWIFLTSTEHDVRWGTVPCGVFLGTMWPESLTMEEQHHYRVPGPGRAVPAVRKRCVMQFQPPPMAATALVDVDAAGDAAGHDQHNQVCKFI